MNKTTLVNIFSTVLLQSISFISAPLISRMLGAENYGITSVYLTWVSFALIIFGGQTLATLNIAQVEFPEEEQPRYQSSVMGLSLLLFAIGTAVVLIFIKPISRMLKLHEWIILCIMIHSCGQYCVNFLNTKFTYEFKAEKNLILSLVVSVSVLLVSVILVFAWPKEINYWGRILAMTLVYFLIGSWICLYLFRQGRQIFNKAYWKFALPLALPIVAHDLAGTVLGQCDRIMLQQQGTNTMVGIYSLSAAFGAIMMTIWDALNNSWVPYLTDFLKNKQTDQIEKHGKYYLELYTVLTVGFILLAPEVFRVFAEKEYWSGGKLIPIFAVNAYWIFLYAFPVNYEFIYKQTKAIAAGTILAGLCNVLMNYFFIYTWGEMGAGLATMLSNLMLFLFHHYFLMWLCKIENYPFQLRLLIPYTLPVLVVATYVFLVEGYWWLRWGIGAVLGFWELYRMYARKTII